MWLDLQSLGEMGRGLVGFPHLRRIWSGMLAVAEGGPHNGSLHLVAELSNGSKGRVQIKMQVFRRETIWSPIVALANKFNFAAIKYGKGTYPQQRVILLNISETRSRFWCRLRSAALPLGTSPLGICAWTERVRLRTVTGR